MAGLVFLLVFWVLAGACQRHGVGGFLLCNSSSSCFILKAPARPWTTSPSGAFFPGLDNKLQWSLFSGACFPELVSRNLFSRFGACYQGFGACYQCFSHQYPLFPGAAPSVVRAEMVDPHERLSVRAAACVTNASSDVVLMVAASDLPWVLDRGCVKARGYSMVKSFPMHQSRREGHSKIETTF